jgi:hypothetical protein
VGDKVHGRRLGDKVRAKTIILKPNSAICISARFIWVKGTEVDNGVESQVMVEWSIPYVGVTPGTYKESFSFRGHLLTCLSLVSDSMNAI